MKHHTSPSEEPWETDPVWNLVDQAAPHRASGRFVDDTVRAARLSTPDRFWSWKLPWISAGLAGATAAIAFAWIMSSQNNPSLDPVTVERSSAEEIQEIAETEILIAAVDHIEEFSDTELVTLIGF